MLILPDWLREQNTALLIVVLLLILWLWLLVRRREEEATTPSRPSPMSADELGRFVFMAARSRDLSRYRGLFINGSEARDILKELAGSYLEHRSYTVLKDSLAVLSEQLPDKAVYDGLGEQKGRMLTIRIRDASGASQILKIGTVTQIGSIWRLLEPASVR